MLLRWLRGAIEVAGSQPVRCTLATGSQAIDRALVARGDRVADWICCQRSWPCCMKIQHWKDALQEIHSWLCRLSWVGVCLAVGGKMFDSVLHGSKHCSVRTFITHSCRHKG